MNNRLHWKQLIHDGCPQCGLIFDDLYQNDNGTVSCPLCNWSIKFDELLGWVAGLAQCRICGREEAYIAPCTCDTENMECANCGCMTMEMIRH